MPVHQLIDTWIASTFWPLWLVLLWTLTYKYLNVCFHVSWVNNLGSRISQLCGDSDILRNMPDCFHSRHLILYSHQQCVKVLISPRLTNAWYFPLHENESTRWYLTVVLVCISLMTLSIFSHAYRSFVLVFLRDICSDLSFIFQSCLSFDWWVVSIPWWSWC